MWRTLQISLHRDEPMESTAATGELVRFAKCNPPRISAVRRLHDHVNLLDAYACRSLCRRSLPLVASGFSVKRGRTLCKGWGYVIRWCRTPSGCETRPRGHPGRGSRDGGRDGTRAVSCSKLRLRYNQIPALSFVVITPPLHQCVVRFDHLKLVCAFLGDSESHLDCGVEGSFSYQYAKEYSVLGNWAF